MTEVIEDSFMIYHSLDKKKLVSKIRKIEKRITEIEKKQADRFPHLIERLDRIEKELLELKKDTHTHALYAGTAVPITKDDAEGGSW